ncbi:hypothetical protein C3433_27075 [Citrobacter freundii]|nr:EAL domain-containing protein [Salmonella enterica subsp. enterica serovar Javiana]POT23839.1 hypothetical protein C3433_27075 [Citrobacter freundii]EEK7952544.1 EAL domain-containing protein [Salmonella enterica subsp. enterica serovar Javiana]EEK7979894.1 EAL domain-containing protein [Salmonella enterica subsp. enterica serovar Javiana]EEK8041076.1 EAL domain-containing protein [Salmonella enterica subsp. enterica serovar Javiana]
MTLSSPGAGADKPERNGMINRYKQHYLCEPVYSVAGQLKAVEVLTGFTTAGGNDVSWNELTDILTPEYKWLNFVRQLHVIRQVQDWLIPHRIMVSVNLDEETAHCLVADENVLALLSAMPFIRLEVNECFTSSYKEKHGLLTVLRRHADLWLDDVGSGSHNNFELLVRGYFSGAKIDKSFFWQHHATHTERLDKVIRDLTRYAAHVIVEGIETREHLKFLVSTPQCWMQGYYFPRVRAEHIRMLPLWLHSVAA